MPIFLPPPYALEMSAGRSKTPQLERARRRLRLRPGLGLGLRLRLRLGLRLGLVVYVIVQQLVLELRLVRHGDRSRGSQGTVRGV